MYRALVVAILMPFLMAPGDGSCTGDSRPPVEIPITVHSQPIDRALTVPGSGSVTLAFTIDDNADAFPLGGPRPELGNLVIDVRDATLAEAIVLDASVDGFSDAPPTELARSLSIDWYTPDVECAPGCRRTGQLVLTRTEPTPLTVNLRFVANLGLELHYEPPAPAVTLTLE